MDMHALFLAALLALTTVVAVGQHSAQIDRFIDQVAQPQQWTSLPICGDVELSVVCMPLTDIPTEPIAPLQ
jgi:hypothetical protein